MSDVFVSYSHTDKAFVQILHNALEASNRETWVDWENIPRGTQWWREIEAGIEGANTFVFVISPDSVESEVCGDEINHAIKNGKRFLPIVRRNVEFSKAGDINPSHKHLKEHNWLFFREEDDFDQSFADLVISLETDIDYVQQHTEFLREALKWEHNKRNDSFLLQGDALTEAERWLVDAEQRSEKARLAEDNVKKKDPNPLLTEQQRNFILKSRENEDAKAKAAQILREAKEKADLERERAEQETEKANKRIKIGSVFLAISLIGAAIAGVYAYNRMIYARQKEGEAQIAIETAKDQTEEAKKQTLIANQKTAVAIRAQEKLVDLDIQKKAIETKAKQVEKDLVLAGKNLTLAKGELTIAQQQQLDAEQAATSARKEKNIAQQATQTAEQAKTKAEIAKQTAENDQKNAEIAKQNAENERQLAQTGTKLERLGVTALQQFDVQNLDGLLLAMQAGKDLKDLVQKHHINSLQEYPAISPLFSLEKILGNITEHNKFNEPGKTNIGIDKAVFSPDGQYIALLKDYGYINVFNLRGQETRPQFFVYKTMDLDFISGNQYLLTWAGADDRLVIWNLSDLSQEKPKVEEIIKDPPNCIPSDNKLNLNSDKKYFAFICSGGNTNPSKIYLWDFSTRQLTQLFQSVQNENIEFIDFNGQYIAASTFIVNDQRNIQKRLVRLWDLSGKQIAEAGQSPELFITGIQISQDGQYLVVLEGYSNLARLWKRSGENLNTFEKIKDLKKVNNFYFSPDNKNFATVDSNGKIQIQSLLENSIINLDGEYKLDNGNNLKFSKDGQYIVAASVDGKIGIWNIEGKLLLELKGKQESVIAFDFRPEQQRLVTVRSDGTIQVWNLPELSSKLQTYFVLHDFPTTDSISISPDGKYIAMKDGNKWQLWNLSSQATKLTLGSAKDVTFSPDAQTIAASESDGITQGITQIQLWNLLGQKISSSFKAYNAQIMSQNFSPDGKAIITAGFDDPSYSMQDLRSTQGKVKIWTLSGSKFPGFKEFAVNGTIKKIALSEDKQRITTLTTDGKAFLWDFSGKQLSELTGHSSGVKSLDFSPDSQQIVTLGSQGLVKLWDRAGKQKFEFITGHGINSQLVKFSPDGDLIATVGTDGIVRLWDLTGRQRAEFQAPRQIDSIAFSKDSIFTTSTDGTMGQLPISNLDKLLKRGCEWLKNYLAVHPDAPKVCSPLTVLDK